MKTNSFLWQQSFKHCRKYNRYGFTDREESGNLPIAEWEGSVSTTVYSSVYNFEPLSRVEFSKQAFALKSDRPGKLSKE